MPVKPAQQAIKFTVYISQEAKDGIYDESERQHISMTQLIERFGLGVAGPKLDTLEERS